jgi:hypothetical protein
MEQVFIILAVLLFWIFKGVAGGQRRVPGQDPYDGDSSSPGGPRDIAGATRQKTLEAQQVALEALQRWEEKQKLSSGYGGPAQAAPGSVPAASRTRIGRPAAITGRGAERQRREAFADIARMLDPGQPAGSAPARRSSLEVSTPARPVADRRPSDAAMKRDAARKDEAALKEAAAQESAASQEARASGRSDKVATPSVLAKLESLPLAARAIVYSEILGRPRSLS